METIYVDFNNGDSRGRIRLNTVGSLKSIKVNNIELIEGKEVQLDDEEGLRNIGILVFSQAENMWVAEIDPERYIYY